MKRYVKNLKEGDVAAFSSCVAAIIGRMLMEEPCRYALARFTSKIIAGRHPVGAFTSSAPMANPLSAQTALEEVGSLRILAAIAAGGIGKVLGRDGWFYVVAGPQVAQIDDILGSLPPYDYYVMLGPKDPYLLSNRIAGASARSRKRNCRRQRPGIAWAFATRKESTPRPWRRDGGQPAGNQDQMTPIVLVRRATGESADSAGSAVR